jgi:hypothetical protein
MRLMKSFTASLIALLILTKTTPAQNTSVQIDPKEQKTVIDSVSRLLADNYIFPDVAKKMADLLQANYKKGSYQGITSAPTFAQKLTEDLRSVSKDKHLRCQLRTLKACVWATTALKKLSCSKATSATSTFAALPIPALPAKRP